MNEVDEGKREKSYSRTLGPSYTLVYRRFLGTKDENFHFSPLVDFNNQPINSRASTSILSHPGESKPIVCSVPVPILVPVPEPKPGLELEKVAGLWSMALDSRPVCGNCVD